jgi:alpha-beta hydrolase superfamily lysophospholipase
MSIVLFGATAILLLLAAAIVFGGPGTPVPMKGLNDPFSSVDFSSLPILCTYQGVDGTDLAYREYDPVDGVAKGSAVLVHGSSADSQSMHPMAKALASAGLRVFALDIRGHGSSGEKGQIDYVGQLESDLQAFANTVRPPSPSTLIGFSSGGGFALRVAGSDMQSTFQSYLLLSPFLGGQAAIQRPNSGGWVSVGLPRIIALVALNSIGIGLFNSLPVTRFALSEEARAFLTPAYGFNLTLNFAPNQDFVVDMKSAQGRVAVLAGSEDEAFYTEKLEPIVRGAGKAWPVTLLPGLGHVQLSLDPQALDAIVKQVVQLQYKA